jgi:hypothetical protein
MTVRSPKKPIRPFFNLGIHRQTRITQNKITAWVVAPRLSLTPFTNGKICPDGAPHLLTNTPRLLVGVRIEMDLGGLALVVGIRPSWIAARTGCLTSSRGHCLVAKSAVAAALQHEVEHMRRVGTWLVAALPYEAAPAHVLASHSPPGSSGALVPDVECDRPAGHARRWLS